MPGAALDDAPVIPEVEGLAADERGLLLGVLRGGMDLAGAAGRLSGPSGERCRAALAALPAGARAPMAEALAAELRAPWPAGLERVHPGWLRRPLEAERAELIRAVVRDAPPAVRRVADELLAARGETGGPSPDGPAPAGLPRAVFGSLAPMPAAARGGPPRARALSALAPEALLAEIDRRGAEALGLALAGAPDAVVARAAAGAGQAWARVVLAAARSGPTAEARAVARSLVGEVPAAASARGAVRAVGLRAVARDLSLEGVAALAAVAQRLPPAYGDALLARAAAGGEAA
jgi:hypothetical protein